MPFLLPFMQRSRSVNYSTPGYVLLVATRYKLEKLYLLFCIEVGFQCTTSNQLFLLEMQDKS
jgi:hypothetical protein